MNRPTSLYLDLVRFVAAFMVFVSHTVRREWTGGFLWQLGPLGKVAVVIFFVLSGFVIGYAAHERENNGQIYAASRLARIYSVAIPALILTFVLDMAGRGLGLSTYNDITAGYPWAHVPWWLLNGALFLNQVWYMQADIGSNGPYWSMGYEVPYYFVFGIAFYARGPWRWIGAGLVLLLTGPNVAALFPMWLIGLSCYHWCVRRPLGQQAGLAVWVLSSAGLLALLIPGGNYHQLYDDLTFEPGRLHSLLYFYSIAVLFALHIVGFRGASLLLARPLDAAARQIRWLGQRTFALYLFHMPLLRFAAGAAPWGPESWITRAVIMLGIPAAVFVLAEYTEQKKTAWREAFLTVLSRTSRRVVPAPRQD